jgi:hypothetical protein
MASPWDHFLDAMLVVGNNPRRRKGASVLFQLTQLMQEAIKQIFDD